MQLKNGWIATVAGLAAITLAGCNNGGNNGGNNTQSGDNASTSGSSGANGGQAEATSLRIGFNPTIAQPQPLLGAANGEYAAQMKDTKFTFSSYKAGPAVVEVLRSGVIDIGCSGIYPPLKGFAKDGDIVLLAGAAKGGTELMVAKASPFKTLQDLKGKTIGVNQLGSTVDTTVRNKLLEAGLSPDRDVKIIPVDPAEQADVLKSGDVQAIAAPAPWPSVAVVNADARPLLDWKTILDNGNYLAGSFYTTKKFAQANPQLLKRFIAANAAITDRLNRDRAKGDAQVLAAWSKISKKKLSPEVARAAFKTIQYTLDARPEDLQRFADMAFKVGALKKKADLIDFVFQAP